jgi:hypothetical protein
MNKKILVSYLFTSFDNKRTLINFINHYKFYNAGISHTLLICFKLLDKKKIFFFKSLLKHIKYVEFIDPISLNDFDFGSYKRVAQLYHSHKILFLNSHSYPISHNWLKKLLIHYKNKTFIGTSASNESLLTSLKFKKFYKFFSYFYKLLKYKKKFNSFPNPHIRTSSFLLKGSDFLAFIRNKKFVNKEDAWMAESGINGMTNFFKKKKFNIFIVNSDGKKFIENQWKFSETYSFASQSKSLISDKHTRKYLASNLDNRLISEIITWGE